LVDPRLDPRRAQRLEQAQHARAVDVGGVLGLLERHRHVRLRRQVVDLGRPHLRDDAVQARRVAHVAVVQLVDLAVRERAVARGVDARAVEQRGAARHAVHLVALLQQELGQVGAVLPGDAGDQRDLSAHLVLPFLDS